MTTTTSSYLDNKKKKYIYLSGDGERAMTLTNDEGEWKVDDFSISNSLKAFRVEAIAEAEKEYEISNEHYMALNFIFPFALKHFQSLYKLPEQVVKPIIKSLSIPSCIDVEEHLILWCNALIKKIQIAKNNEDNEDSYDEAYILLNELEAKAIKNKNLNEKKMVRLLRLMLAKCPSWQRSPVTEDTLIIQSLVAIFDIFLNCEAKYTHAWTHGYLNTTSATSVTSAASATPTTSPSTTSTKRKRAACLIKPDFVLRYTAGSRQFDVFVVEVTKKEAKVSQTLTDTCKLAYELKVIVDNLVSNGVTKAEACGMLVEGDYCKVFRLDLYKEAVYRFVCVGQFNLPRDYTDFCLLPNIMEEMLLVKSLIDKTVRAIEEVRSSSPIPSHYRRPSFPLPFESDFSSL